MAQAFAKIAGIDAYSAGSRPSGKVNPKAIETMKEVGYDLTMHHSKSLDDVSGIHFDAAVTMGCGDQCPNLLATQRFDWQIPDPREMPPQEFRAVRDLIRNRVDELVNQLKS